jgi:hypothetical protein
MGTPMKQDTVVETFMRRFPELKELYKEALENSEDGSLGHVFFGDVMSKYLDANLPVPQDEALLARVFEFFEEMADLKGYVEDILCDTILERLGDDPEKYMAAWPFMGEKTRECAVKAERGIGRSYYNKFFKSVTPRPRRKHFLFFR